MRPASLAGALANRVPFYYGWVVLGLRVLRRLCPRRAGGCHAFHLRGADDQRIRLVAHRAFGRGFDRRGPGRRALSGDRLAARPPRAAPDPRRGRARDRRHTPAALADRIAAGVLSAVLHCAHELRGPVRPRHLRRGQQLVHRAPRARGLDRQHRGENRTGSSSAHGLCGHLRARLAGGMAGHRHGRARGRLSAGGAADRETPGGHRPGARRHGGRARHEPSRRRHAGAHCRARFHARRGTADPCVLDALPVHADGLSGPGGDQPAHGGAPDRARLEPRRRRGLRQHLHVLVHYRHAGVRHDCAPDRRTGGAGDHRCAAGGRRAQHGDGGQCHRVHGCRHDVRAGNWRFAGRAAGGVGRLLRPPQLRRHPRGRTDDPG